MRSPIAVYISREAELMYSIVRLGDRSVSLPLAADDVLEFHAGPAASIARAVRFSGRIDGLTKMAKLDFFVRYPEFYAVARAVELGEPGTLSYQRGQPWNPQWFDITTDRGTSVTTMSWLTSNPNGLLEVRPMRGTTYQLSLTPRGREVASELAETDSFGGISERMRDVKSVLGGKSGTKLKTPRLSTLRRRGWQALPWRGDSLVGE